MNLKTSTRKSRLKPKQIKSYAQQASVAPLIASASGTCPSLHYGHVNTGRHVRQNYHHSNKNIAPMNEMVS